MLIRGTPIFKGWRASPAIIFDLFGTLIDLRSDDEAHKELSKWLAEIHGKAFSWEEHYKLYLKLVNEGKLRSGEAVWKALKELLKGKEPSIKYEDVIKKHAELHASKAELIPCAWEAVSRAKISVGKVALVTDADRATTEAVLNAVGLTFLFDVIVTRDDVREGKPSPEPFIKALQALGEQASNVVVIGDSCSDVVGAHRAGMKVILVGGAECDEKPEAVAKDALTAIEVATSLIGIERGFEGVSCG